MHAIITVIVATNAPSIRMLAAFGFEQVGYLRDVSYKFSRWLNLIFVELLLDQHSTAALGDASGPVEG